MEIPESIRIKILTVLLSIGQKGGVTLDCFDRLFQEAMREPVQYQALGYSSLLEFFRAVPDVGLEYDEDEEAWKVYGTPRPARITPTEQRRQAMMMDAQHDTQPRAVTFQGRLRKESFGVDAVSVCSTEPDPDHVPVDVDKLVLVPDDRGQYSICFPRSKRPGDWNSLHHMFSMAGSVSRIHETATMVFVRYDSPDKVRLALKMFPFLDLRLGWRNDGSQTQMNHANAINTSPRGIRRPATSQRKAKVFRMDPDEERIVEVMIDNLDNGHSITKVHIEDLFQGYDIRSVNIVYNRDSTAKSASVRLAAEWEAEELVSEFDGYNFCGKQLSVYIKGSRFPVSPQVQAFKKQVNFPIIGGQDPVGPSSPKKSVSPKLEKTHIPSLPCLAHIMEELGRTPAISDCESLSSKRKLMCVSEEEPRKAFPGRLIEDMEQTPDEEALYEVSAMEREVQKTGVEVPAIFVTNFLSKFTQKDVRRWFAKFKPLSIEIIHNDRGLKKAYLELPNKQQVRSAIAEMCHENVKGLFLKVDVPYFLPKLRQEILGTGGKISIKRNKRPQVTTGDLGLMQELVESRNQVIVALLQTQTRLICGQIEVIVTNVVTDKLFFGQVLDKEAMESLRQISEEMNKPCEDPLPPRRDGPCIVHSKKDNLFHRGWILGHKALFAEADVFFVDGGHVQTVPKWRMRTADHMEIWDLQPLAVPFTLSEPVVNLRSRLGTHIIVEIQTVQKNGVVVAKPISLLPNSTELLKTVKKLVI